jgi:large subunit ribosomal protein L25
MGHISLNAQERSEFGDGPARRLRRQGFVPGVVYQPGGPSLALSLPDRDLRRALAEGRTAVIDLSIEGSRARPVLLKDWYLDPVRGNVLHVDFQEVDLTVEVEAPVGVVLVGVPAGVKEGGVLDQTVREIVVRALPDTLPDHLEIDVSELDIGSSTSVADITAPPGVTIVTEPEIVVASVVAPSVEVEPEPEEVEEEEELLEGEEPAEPQDDDSSDE